jgi:predicted nucleotidyltransferase
MSAPAVTPCLSREDVLAVLREYYPSLAAGFGLSSLQLFGSFATDQQTASSDVGLLASFTEPIGFGFIHLADRLEALLGRKVDLVAANGIKANRRPFILSSLVDVAP